MTVLALEELDEGGCDCGYGLVRMRVADVQLVSSAGSVLEQRVAVGAALRRQLRDRRHPLVVV